MISKPTCDRSGAAKAKGPWTQQEDDMLASLVSHHGARNWSVIAKQLPRRSGKQCRERWLNHLDPTVCKAPWTPEEDAALLRGHRRHGNCWARIARDLPGRTENATKNRWNATIKRRLGTLALDPTAAIELRRRAKEDPECARALFSPADADRNRPLPDMLSHYAALHSVAPNRPPALQPPVTNPANLTLATLSCSRPAVMMTAEPQSAVPQTAVPQSMCGPSRTHAGTPAVSSASIASAVTEQAAADDGVRSVLRGHHIPTSAAMSPTSTSAAIAAAAAAAVAASTRALDRSAISASSGLSLSLSGSPAMFNRPAPVPVSVLAPSAPSAPASSSVSPSSSQSPSRSSSPEPSGACSFGASSCGARTRLVVNNTTAPSFQHVTAPQSVVCSYPQPSTDPRNAQDHYPPARYMGQPDAATIPTYPVEGAALCFPQARARHFLTGGALVGTTESNVAMMSALQGPTGDHTATGDATSSSVEAPRADVTVTSQSMDALDRLCLSATANAMLDMPSAGHALLQQCDTVRSRQGPVTTPQQAAWTRPAQDIPAVPALGLVPFGNSVEDGRTENIALTIPVGVGELCAPGVQIVGDVPHTTSAVKTDRLSASEVGLGLTVDPSSSAFAAGTPSLWNQEPALNSELDGGDFLAESMQVECAGVRVPTLPVSVQDARASCSQRAMDDVPLFIGQYAPFDHPVALDQQPVSPQDSFPGSTLPGASTGVYPIC